LKNYDQNSISINHRHPRKAPGPTSCFFLEKALKRIYPKEDFEILESLGEGFFSNVYKVKLNNTDEVMVLKIVKERENRLRAKANIMKEITVLNQLVTHPNLIEFRFFSYFYIFLYFSGVCIDSCSGTWNMHILVDFCDGGSLNRLITDRSRSFSWKMRFALAKDISAAMCFVHSKNVMHRDLTSMNVLLQTLPYGNLKAVVADFGLSCPIPSRNELLVQVGTPFWMAPECLKEEFYNEKADIFSYGIILCQMIARIEADPEAGLCRTNNFGLDYVRFTAYCENDTPLDFLQLAFHCCLMNPTGRPSFSRIYDRLNSFTYRQWKDHVTARNFDSQSLVTEQSKVFISLFLFVMSWDVQCPMQLSLPPAEVAIHSNIVRQKTSKNQNRLSIENFQSVCYSSKENFGFDKEQFGRKLQMEELARSIAIEELSDEASSYFKSGFSCKESSIRGNPFLNHQIYSTTRKLGLFKISRKNVRKEKINDNKSHFMHINSITDRQNIASFNMTVNVENNDRKRKNKEFKQRRSRSFPCSAFSRKDFTSTFPRLSCYRRPSNHREVIPADIKHRVFLSMYIEQKNSNNCIGSSELNQLKKNEQAAADSVTINLPSYNNFLSDSTFLKQNNSNISYGSQPTYINRSTGQQMLPSGKSQDICLSLNPCSKFNQARLFIVYQVDLRETVVTSTPKSNLTSSSSIMCLMRRKISCKSRKNNHGTIMEVHHKGGCNIS
uniref:Protein kinase domain-containing protein n=1 Tax=Dracunculus medinensis TaxID=318479 RepID=A0A0N4UIC4_DRAME